MKKAIFILVIVASTILSCDGTKSKLNGTWELVESPAIPNYSTSQVKAIKIYSDTYFSANIFDKNTGHIITVNSGSYQLNGGTYTEKITNSTLSSTLNTTADYTITFEGNRMIVEGTIRDGKAKLKEVWEKMK